MSQKHVSFQNSDFGSGTDFLIFLIFFYPNFIFFTLLLLWVTHYIYIYVCVVVTKSWVQLWKDSTVTWFTSIKEVSGSLFEWNFVLIFCSSFFQFNFFYYFNLILWSTWSCVCDWFDFVRRFFGFLILVIGCGD